MGNCGASFTEKISKNIFDTRFESFDQAAVKNAKKRIIDVVGCLISGAYAPGNAGLVELIKNWGGRGEASVLVHGGKVPAANAAMINSIMARSFDFEVCNAFVEGGSVPSHISGTTIMTALAVGEANNTCGREFITSLLIGDDIACRLLAAAYYGMSHGWDGTGTANAVGAAAVAARLLNLSQKQIQNAFGIVLNQLGGSLLNIWEGTTCFKLPQGLSARNGVFSAELAKTGWTGPEDAFLGKFGYFDLYTQGFPNRDLLIKNLGKEFYAEATFKPYPCCRANHSAIDCTLKIVQENHIELDEIDQIILKIPQRILRTFPGQPFKIREVPQIDATFNLSFCVSNVLLRESISLEHFQDNMITEPKVVSIANKIQIFDSGDMSVSLVVKMKDGQEYFSNVKFPKGDPILSPLSKQDIEEKFINNVIFARTIPKKNAEEFLYLIENLEQVGNINELSKLLVIS